MTSAIGFIGLGRMGGPMARNLSAARYTVHAFDVDAAAATRLTAACSASIERSPRDVAAKATVLFTALPNNQIVRDTYLGERGVLAGAQAGVITCDCSTVSPEVSQDIHAPAPARGATPMDTPLVGGTPQATSGEVSFIRGR